MEALTQFTAQFEDAPLTTYVFEGRPCWIAREFGRALGYENDAKRFVELLTKDWADELVDGADLVKLTGKKLRDFKRMAEVGPESGLTSAPAVVLVFESGAHVACLKTEKPMGKKLRRFLADDVLPELARTGEYSRELRLPSPEVELEDRKFKASTLQRTLDVLREMKRIGDDVYVAHQVRVAELAAGQSFPALLPSTAETWLAPAQIAERLGVTAARVGLTITALGLRGEQAGLCRAVLNTARGHNKTVTSFQYTPAAVQQIEEALRSGGYLAAAA